MKHTLYVDRKVTIWERTAYTIEAETEEQAREILAQKVDANVADEYEFTEEEEGDAEFLLESIIYMSESDNDGESVCEVITEDEAAF